MATLCAISRRSSCARAEGDSPAHDWASHDGSFLSADGAYRGAPGALRSGDGALRACRAPSAVDAIRQHAAAAAHAQELIALAEEKVPCLEGPGNDEPR